MLHHDTVAGVVDMYVIQTMWLSYFRSLAPYHHPYSLPSGWAAFVCLLDAWCKQCINITITITITIIIIISSNTTTTTGWATLFVCFVGSRLRWLRWLHSTHTTQLRKHSRRHGRQYVDVQCHYHHHHHQHHHHYHHIITTIIIVLIVIEMSVRGVHFQTREEGNPYLPLTSRKSSDCTEVTTGLQANIHTKNTENSCKKNATISFCSTLKNKIQITSKYKIEADVDVGEWWVGVKRLLSIFCKQSLHQVADTWELPS